MKKALKIIAVVSVAAAMFISGIEKNGVKYRYIFDDDDPDPTLEWNDDGVRHRENFYEY